MTEHATNGSPENPLGQAHIGLWFITSHLALSPQDPIQGFTHF